jgi:hypothetical protein
MTTTRTELTQAANTVQLEGPPHLLDATRIQIATVQDPRCGLVPYREDALALVEGFFTNVPKRSYAGGRRPGRLN